MGVAALGDMGYCDPKAACLQGAFVMRSEAP